MPLFMDVHNMEGGVSSADVAKAHQADLETQGKAHGLVADEIYEVSEHS